MPSMIPSSLRFWVVLMVIGVGWVGAAEPVHELVGASREQVIRRLGEPRSQLEAGNRIVLLYARERIVLREGVVVEVEPLAVEASRRPAPVASKSPTPVAADPAAPAAPGTAVPVTPPVPPSAVPILPVANAPVGASPEAVPPPPKASAPAPAVEPTSSPESERKLEIKLVRSPSARDYDSPSPAPAPVAAPLPARPAPAAPTPIVTALAPAPTSPPAAVGSAVAAVPLPASSPSGPASTIPAATDPLRPVAVDPAGAPVPPETEKADESAAPKSDAAAGEKAKKKAELLKVYRRRMDAARHSAEEEAASPAFPLSTILIGVLVVAGGIGFLVWRKRRHEVEMEVSAVREVAPTPSAALGGHRGRTTFTPEALSRLEWKRFQEVVADYYCKTGVVAVRVKSGPLSPVHIRISWKGEPLPFACVRCIAEPHGLIEAPVLQEMLTVLEGENIRRGYVVTTGRFSVAARDLAEKKQLTLLPGDILLEKLNALPEPARAEIMQGMNAGDATTPSCPVCETKMARGKEDPSVWRCASHPEISLPARD